MTVPCTLRRAGPGDGATLLRFIQALADYEREPDAVETDEATLEAQLRSDEPPFECLIAEDHGQPVGFALWFHTYSTWRGRRGLYLEDLFVPPDQRGRGIGATLLRELAAIAVERGCARMEWAVLDWNEPAQGFYRRLGAAPLEEWSVWRLTDRPLRELAASARS